MDFSNYNPATTLLTESWDYQVHYGASTGANHGFMVVEGLNSRSSDWNSFSFSIFDKK